MSGTEEGQLVPEIAELYQVLDLDSALPDHPMICAVADGILEKLPKTSLELQAEWLIVEVESGTPKTTALLATRVAATLAERGLGIELVDALLPLVESEDNLPGGRERLGRVILGHAQFFALQGNWKLAMESLKTASQYGEMARCYPGAVDRVIKALE